VFDVEHELFALLLDFRHVLHQVRRTLEGPSRLACISSRHSSAALRPASSLTLSSRADASWEPSDIFLSLSYVEFCEARSKVLCPLLLTSHGSYLLVLLEECFRVLAPRFSYCACVRCFFVPRNCRSVRL